MKFIWLCQSAHQYPSSALENSVVSSNISLAPLSLHCLSGTLVKHVRPFIFLVFLFPFLFFPSFFFSFLAFSCLFFLSFLFFSFLSFIFLLNLLRQHWLIKLYRFQVYKSIIHHLYIVLYIHGPKSSFLSSPFIPSVPFSTSRRWILY